MKKTHRAAGVLLALAGAGALALTSTSSASAAATWTLEQGDQRVCSRPDTGPHNFYFIAPVTGSTSEPINIELQDLPTNVTNTGGTIYPDELNEPGKWNGFVGLTIGPTPAGEYDIKMVASDGTDTQSSPARISIKSDC